MSCSDETYKHILDAGRGFGVALYALILFVLWYCCPELEIFNLEGIWAATCGMLGGIWDGIRISDEALDCNKIKARCGFG